MTAGGGWASSADDAVEVRAQGWRTLAALHGMQQLARAAALSPSATTRLVNRLEDRALLTRVLCADDWRGIYTEPTAAGRALYERARPIHDETLERVLAEAGQQPELAGRRGIADRRSAGRRRLTRAPLPATRPRQ